VLTKFQGLSLQAVSSFNAAALLWLGLDFQTISNNLVTSKDALIRNISWLVNLSQSQRAVCQKPHNQGLARLVFFLP